MTTPTSPNSADRALAEKLARMIAGDIDKALTKLFGSVGPDFVEKIVADQVNIFAPWIAAHRSSAVAEARGLVEFLNKPLPVNSRAALVERCYQVQLICETIPPHENQTKTAIALSELVTAIRESSGRDETLADLAKAREDAAGFQVDLQSVQRENAALREAGDRLFRHAGVLVKYKNNQEEPLWQNLCNGINAWDRAIQGAALTAALHPATKEGKA